MATLPLPWEQALSVFSLSCGESRGSVDSILCCLHSNLETSCTTTCLTMHTHCAHRRPCLTYFLRWSWDDPEKLNSAFKNSYLVVIRYVCSKVLFRWILYQALILCWLFFFFFFTTFPSSYVEVAEGTCVPFPPGVLIIPSLGFFCCSDKKEQQQGRNY